jgi:predicted nucleic acid-binding protein
MSYLLDTCVLSELVKKNPSPSVVAWFNRQEPEHLFMSRVSIAEIQKGLHKIQAAQPERHRRLSLWLKRLEASFSGRVLPLSDSVLDDWARLSAEAEMRGRKLAVMDGLIAATATRHQLQLVTRNVDDFDIPNLMVLNPYIEA